MNQIAKTDAAEIARGQATERLHQVADMTLHELVDEYVALTGVIKAGTIESPENFSTRHTDEAKVAMQNRNLVNGATRARFGIEFDTFDSLF